MIEIARTFLGVPFHHQGRSLSGIDCVGLMVRQAQLMGWDVRDCTTYGRRAHPEELLYHWEQSFVEIPARDAGPGDWVMFFIHKPTKPQHVAMLTEPGRMIHTHNRIGKVLEGEIGSSWTPRVHSYWRYKWLLSH